MKFLPLLFVTLLMSMLCTQRALACSCFYIDNFCETIFSPDASNGVWPDLVVRGKIKEQSRDGVTIEIVDQIIGETDDTTLFITSGDGANCGLDTKILNMNMEYLLAIDENHDSISYSLSICGTTFLEIDNGIIKGKVSSQLENIAYTELREALECGNFPPDSQEDNFSVFPNPSSDIVFVRSNKETPAPFQIRLYNSFGQLIVSKKVNSQEDGNIIPLELIAIDAGIYWVEINSDTTGRTVKKMVKAQ